jgi:hypothetical protein
MGTDEPADNDRPWRKNECITVVSVDNSKTRTRPGDSFVDDTTTDVTSDDTTRDPVLIDEKDLTADEAELIEQMQVVIHFFLDLIQVTGGVLIQRNACGTLSYTGKKRCTNITRKKSEPSRDINYIQCNGTNNTNQEKGDELGTPQYRVSSDRRWNFNIT